MDILNDGFTYHIPSNDVFNLRTLKFNRTFKLICLHVTRVDYESGD